MVEYLGVNNAARERDDVAVYLGHDLVEDLLAFTGNVPAHVLVEGHADGQGAENAEAVIGKVGRRGLRTVESTVGDRLKHIGSRYDGVGRKALHGHAAAGAVDDRFGEVGRILVRSAAGAPCALIHKIISLAACGGASAAGLSAAGEKRCCHNKYQSQRYYLFCSFHVVFPFRVSARPEGVLLRSDTTVQIC